MKTIKKILAWFAIWLGVNAFFGTFGTWVIYMVSNRGMHIFTYQWLTGYAWSGVIFACIISSIIGINYLSEL